MKKAMAKTTHHDVVVIKQLLNFAVRRKLIRENPLADLKLPKPKRTPQPYWKRDEVELILKHTSPRYKPLFHFLADTGTRVGEACWLTWADIDLEQQVVLIRGKDDWQPKSGDERSIHLSNDLQHLLAALPRAERWVFKAPVTARHPAPDRQVSPRRALQHLKVVLRKLSLPGHLHTFRHSFISHALNAGATPSVVREWVGHVDEDIMAVYTHVADQHSRRTMEEILPGTSLSKVGKGA